MWLLLLLLPLPLLSWSMDRNIWIRNKIDLAAIIYHTPISCMAHRSFIRIKTQQFIWKVSSGGLVPGYTPCHCVTHIHRGVIIRYPIVILPPTHRLPLCSHPIILHHLRESPASSSRSSSYLVHWFVNNRRVIGGFCGKLFCHLFSLFGESINNRRSNKSHHHHRPPVLQRTWKGDPNDSLPLPPSTCFCSKSCYSYCLGAWIPSERLQERINKFLQLWVGGRTELWQNNHELMFDMNRRCEGVEVYCEWVGGWRRPCKYIISIGSRKGRKQFPRRLGRHHSFSHSHLLRRGVGWAQTGN